jgi:uncharacterized protein YjeT (DUF2065 family)
MSTLTIVTLVICGLLAISGIWRLVHPESWKRKMREFEEMKATPLEDLAGRPKNTLEELSRRRPPWP